MKVNDCCNVKNTGRMPFVTGNSLETTKLIVEKAGLHEDNILLAFNQDWVPIERFNEWLKPYTDKTLKEMPKKGIKNLAVLCPAFFCDCLETLEEIEEEGKEIFMDAGGESYRMIPCLNDSSEGINC